MEAFATRAEGGDAEKALAAAWEWIDEFGGADGAVCDAACQERAMALSPLASHGALDAVNLRSK